MSFSFDDPASIEHVLRDEDILRPDECVESITKPGEGNMNFVARVATPNRSFILKQAKPYVEKYPEIAAPRQRAIVETIFYELVRGNDAVNAAMPQLIFADREHHYLVLEDLGNQCDYTDLYQGRHDLSPTEVDQLTSYLTNLHNGFIESTTRIKNRAMRELNAEHIFKVPFASSDCVDLDAITPGLAKERKRVCANDEVRQQAEKLQSLYLSDGESLLHGDFFPGAWLRTDAGIRVIDPEFGFHGAKEFDVGVMQGHLDLTFQGAQVRQRFDAWIRESPAYDPRTVDQFAGIEIIRRLLGVAQLGLNANLDAKRALLERAVTYLTKS